MTDLIIFKLQAELCQSMSQPGRLQILHALFDGPKNDGEIVKLTGLSQTTVSKHLSILKNKNMVLSHRQGKKSSTEFPTLKLLKYAI